jgi:hypothetical protein
MAQEELMTVAVLLRLSSLDSVYAIRGIRAAALNLGRGEGKLRRRTREEGRMQR